MNNIPYTVCFPRFFTWIHMNVNILGLCGNFPAVICFIFPRNTWPACSCVERKVNTARIETGRKQRDDSKIGDGLSGDVVSALVSHGEGRWFESAWRHPLSPLKLYKWVPDFICNWRRKDGQGVMLTTLTAEWWQVKEEYGPASEEVRYPIYYYGGD